MEVKMGESLDPIEGRDEACQEAKARNLSALVKARSIVLGLCIPVKGNRV